MPGPKMPGPKNMKICPGLEDLVCEKSVLAWRTENMKNLS